MGYFIEKIRILIKNELNTMLVNFNEKKYK
jgi:hypothetical protein